MDAGHSSSSFDSHHSGELIQGEAPHGTAPSVAATTIGQTVAASIQQQAIAARYPVYSSREGSEGAAEEQHVKHVDPSQMVPSEGAPVDLAPPPVVPSTNIPGDKTPPPQPTPHATAAGASPPHSMRVGQDMRTPVPREAAGDEPCESPPDSRLAAQRTTLDSPQRRDGEPSESDDDDDSYPWLDKALKYIFPRIDKSFGDYAIDDRTKRLHPGVPLLSLEVPDAAQPPNLAEFIVGRLLMSDRQLALYLPIVVLVVVLTIASMGSSQIDGSRQQCYSFWGYKENCDTGAYTIPVSLLSCKALRGHLQAGAATVVMALVFGLVQLIGLVVYLFFMTPPAPMVTRVRIGVGIAGGLNSILLLISWAVMVKASSSTLCPVAQGSVAPALAYGPGFGCGVTAWLFQMLAAIGVAIPLEPLLRLLHLDN